VILLPKTNTTAIVLLSPEFLIPPYEIRDFIRGVGRRSLVSATLEIDVRGGVSA